METPEWERPGVRGPVRRLVRRLERAMLGSVFRLVSFVLERWILKSVQR